MSKSNSDSQLLQRLLDGDEQAFETLIDDYHAEMVRLANVFVDDESAAEEIVQDTWMAVIDGIENFKGDSSLKTWIFGILTNLARKRGEADARTVNWSSLPEGSLDDTQNGRFDPEGWWSTPPAPWNTDPEEELMQTQLLEIVDEAIEELPASQRAVVTLRDVRGWPSDEVCDVLDISRGNQRVLLHRARSHVREALESNLADDGELEMS